ncbi:MAG TPA: M28 family peptidase [Terriglobales bacterium]|nr:M28 family peptidase [Terriglobales bacterium]
MRRSAFISASLLLSILALGASRPSVKKPVDSAQSLPASAQAAMKLINPERIRAHVKFLSSDLLEGRGTGQRGGDIAADYIATEFALFGLKPAGDNGTYFQKVPMVGIATEPTSTVTLTPGGGKPVALRQGDDIVAMDETQNTASKIDSDLVFVGYGIEAPEYNWNDFKDVSVAGKVLLVLVNEPPSDDPNFFKGKALTYYGRWTYKYEEAARKGAVGAIIIHKTDMASYGWDVVRNSWGGERSYLRSDSDPKLKLAAWMQLDVTRNLLSSVGKDLDTLIEQARSRDFRPVPLPVRVESNITSKIRPFESSNVVAMLPGSDPKFKQQAVIYSAHYDHLGIHPGQPGDNIYNGAIDNGTGCGILLELAHAFASASQPPKRSILFAAVTAEEQGLRGSEFLGRKPPVPAGDIALGLNFDGVAPRGIPEDVDVSGAERTTFYPVVKATAKEFGLEIKPDSNPGAGHYYRSDHFSFARVGVPSFSINEGMKFKGHPIDYGFQLEKDYTDRDYHQPSDEYHADWDFTGLAEITRFGFELGWKAASAPELTAWVPGDEFDTARKASLKAIAEEPDRTNAGATK